MQIADRGHAFEGWAGGRNYHIWSSFFGMTAGFYRKGIGELRLGPGQTALDLGCGTGDLCFALAARSAPDAQITGIDLSEDQLTFARMEAARIQEQTGQDKPVCAPQFRYGSMDLLSFPDNSVDLVMTSMAMHEIPPRARRAAIRETSRVLKPDGLFLLIDWCQPHRTPLGVLWYCIVCRFGHRHDNWRNAYRGLAEARGMMLQEDGYINGFARRQLFRKIL